ncbi:LysR family transcriptional regulator [Oceanobacillus sp. FSL K6-3682]|uniref:LysR family transcriptional regulator n=1 Tax=Oceanobacillus sp. FSL K6-3682 TaxID=2921503 RepID=UPI0030D7D9B4
MEIRILRYFWTIAEEGSVSRAAELLHITQPTLSRQLKELEEELGTELFYREKKQLHLTEAGVFLKDRAEEILSLTDKTEQAFFDQKKQLFSGHISIGCVEADNSDTLTMMLEEMVSDYPQVTFHIFSGTSDDITEKLDKGLIDLAILLEPIALDKYERMTLPRTEKWGVLVSNDSFLAQKKQMSPEDLAGVPLLCSGRTEVQKMIADWMGVSVERINIAGTFNLIFNVFSLVENRVGSALAIEGAVINGNARNVTFVPLSPEIETKCVVAWKKNRSFSPVVNEFIQRMKHAFEA